MDFRECKRKNAALPNFVWPGEILCKRLLCVLFSYLFPSIQTFWNMTNKSSKSGMAVTEFELAIHESLFLDQICLFADDFKLFLVKFVNPNFPSVRIFVFPDKLNNFVKLNNSVISNAKKCENLHYFLKFA